MGKWACYSRVLGDVFYSMLLTSVKIWVCAVCVSSVHQSVHRFSQ